MSAAARQKAAAHGYERFLGDWIRVLESALENSSGERLFMKLTVKLLAGDFGGEHAFGGVADLVLGEMPRPFGHQLR